MEGCSFDGSRLLENHLESPSITTVPPCLVSWVANATPPPYPTHRSISLPVYFSAERERLVTCLDVPCGEDQETWVQCGAAMFLSQ